jgi:hypothetical protein
MNDGKNLFIWLLAIAMIFVLLMVMEEFLLPEVVM